MNKPSFVYVTFIATTPERLWQALVDIDLMKQYWVGIKPDAMPRVNVSDWQPGSPWEHQRTDGSGVADIVGTVIANDPPFRLSYSWARPSEAGDPAKHSRVTFEIEQASERIVKLIVTHEGLERDAAMLASISGGWPQILANLKTLLETGRAMTQ